MQAVEGVYRVDTHHAHGHGHGHGHGLFILASDHKPIQEEEGPPYSMIGSEESPAEESYEESPAEENYDTAQEETLLTQGTHAPETPR